MSSETRDKLDARKFAHITKVVLMTLFAGYAASRCEERLIKDSILDFFGQYARHHNFLFILKYTYGSLSSLMFYLLVFHKYDKKAQHKELEHRNRAVGR